MKIYVFITYIYLLRSKNSDTKYCKFHKPSGSKLTHTIRKKKRKTQLHFKSKSVHWEKERTALLYQYCYLYPSRAFQFHSWMLIIYLINRNATSFPLLFLALLFSVSLIVLSRVELIHTAHSHVPADTHPWASPLPLQSSYTNLSLWSSPGSPREGLSPKRSTPSEHQVSFPAARDLRGKANLQQQLLYFTFSPESPYSAESKLLIMHPDERKHWSRCMLRSRYP